MRPSSAPSRSARISGVWPANWPTRSCALRETIGSSSSKRQMFRGRSLEAALGDQRLRPLVVVVDVEALAAGRDT